MSSGGAPGTGIIVERGLEAALFEAIQPVVDRLVMPSVFVFGLEWREPLKVLACGGKTFDCLRISLVRELLADLTFCEVGDLVFFLGHIPAWSRRLSKSMTVSIQPLDSANPDHVAVDETVIQLNDERFWLYAAVDPATNRLLHVKLSPMRHQAITEMLFAELRDKHFVVSNCFSHADAETGGNWLQSFDFAWNQLI